MPASPLYTLPQRGSAFHRVIPSSSENLRYLPHSAAFSHEEKIPLALTKKDSFEDCSDILSQFNDNSNDDFKNLNDSPDDTNKASPDNGLPLKKRKPRFADLKMEYSDNESPCDQEKALRLQSNDQYTISGINSQACTCSQLRGLEDTLSLSGKFNTWKKEQVQVWLWKTLKDSNKGFSRGLICQILQCIQEKDGFELSTFTKSDWQRKFASSDLPYDFVWERVSERLKDGPFRPHNFSQPPRETIHPISLNTCSPKDFLLTSGAGATALPKRKPNKPQRKRRDKCVGQLWEFVFNLLNNDATNPSVVCWEDKGKRLFRIVNTEEIARLWGKHKGNNNMTYANMSRTMRYYREGNGAFVRNERKRVYGFGPKADFDRLLIKSAKKL